MNHRDREILEMAALCQRIVENRAKDKIGLFKPSPKQLEYMTSTSKVVLLQAGNRFGKTCGGITDDIKFALGRHPYQTHEPPVIIWVVGVDFTNHVKSVLLPTLFEWCPEDEIESITKDPPIIKFKNGSKIYFKSSDSGRARFQGAKIHRLHIDEEIDKDVVEECRARLIDYGGQMKVTLTPITGAQWVRDLAKHPDTHVIRASMLDNPYIDKEAAEDFLATLPEAIRITREAGDFLALSGIIYPEIQDPIYWIKPHERPIDRDANIIMITDPGYRTTASLWIAVCPDDSIIVFQEYYGHERSIIQNSRAIHKMEKHIVNRITRRLIDPAAKQKTAQGGNNSTRDLYLKEGLRFDYAKNDVLAGIFNVKNYLQITDTGFPRIVFWDTLTLLREEFETYIWAEPGTGDKEHPRKGDDHLLDNLRYGLFSKPTFESQEYLRRSWLRDELDEGEEIVTI